MSQFRPKIWQKFGRKKPELRYGHLCAFLEAKLIILGPIDFLFGLPINLIVNAEQNKFEVDILKNVAKIANLRPKIGQIPLLSLDIIWHNSIIFYPILTYFILNCLFLRAESKGDQIKALSLLVKILVFGPIFAPSPHGPKTSLKKSGRVLAFPFNPYFIIKISKIIGLNPPPSPLSGIFQIKIINKPIMQYIYSTLSTFRV